jgi:hypothetical protein
MRIGMCWLICGLEPCILLFVALVTLPLCTTLLTFKSLFLHGSEHASSHLRFRPLDKGY